MTKKQRTFFRDLTFHYNRRNYGTNIPATDIDFLEYDKRQPIDIRELKDRRSRWRHGTSWASMEATWNLAQRAGISYYVVEHEEDWSEIRVCKIAGIERKRPIIDSEEVFTLPEYVESLYTARRRKKPHHIEIPQRLEPITRQKIILELWRELSKQEQQELLLEIRLINSPGF